MLRSDFATKVAKDSHSTLNASRLWTDAVIDSLADAVEKEELVHLRGFGKFEHVMIKPRVGRNYKTGEKIYIPPKTIVKFTPCRKIERAILRECFEKGYTDWAPPNGEVATEQAEQADE